MINDGMVVEMLQMIADGNEGAKIGKESVFDDTEKIYFAIMRLFSDLELPIDEERNRLLNCTPLIIYVERKILKRSFILEVKKFEKHKKRIKL